MDHLPYYPCWEGDGLYELALYLAVSVKSPWAHYAMLATAQLS